MFIDFILFLRKVRPDDIIRRLCNVAALKDRREQIIKTNSEIDEDYFGYNYNDKNPEPSNFTQMVWQNSQLIGFGMQKASNNKYYFVINYYPTGNVEGLFKLNVLPFPINSFE